VYKLKNKKRKTRRNILFNVYCTGGFYLLFNTYIIFNEKIYPKLNYEWHIELGNPPPYQYKLLIQFSGILIIILLFLKNAILGKHKSSFLSILFYNLAIFLIPVGIATIDLGFNLYFILHGIAFGTVFGLIDGIKNHVQDFSFLNDRKISEQVKIAKMQMMQDRWFRYLISLITITIGFIVGTAINHIYKVNSTFYSENLISVSIIVSYLVAGILFGIIKNMMIKMYEIESKLLEIRSK